MLHSYCYYYYVDYYYYSYYVDYYYYTPTTTSSSCHASSDRRGAVLAVRGVLAAAPGQHVMLAALATALEERLAALPALRSAEIKVRRN